MSENPNPDISEAYELKHQEIMQDIQNWMTVKVCFATLKPAPIKRCPC
jgi:hypothetical protein